jgi:putative Holliday junction resolvase
VNPPRKAGVLAIDHGTRHTGFAAADPLRVAVRALETWRGAGHSESLLDRVAELCAEREVDTFVVGLPLNMDGSEGPRSTDVRRFIEKLRGRFPEVAIVVQDERLSTKGAEDLMREVGLRGHQAREKRDSFAALVILRDWIAAGEPH